jgi:hypothetical protein
MTLDEALRLSRIVIAGGPHTGKSYLGREAAVGGRELLETDSWIGRFEWSELSRQVAIWGNVRKRFVIEGVRAAHALRKGLQADVVVWRSRVWPVPGVPRTPGHESQAKAVLTVFDEWRAADGGRTPIVFA